jgi:hypothetical protein
MKTISLFGFAILALGFGITAPAKGQHTHLGLGIVDSNSNGQADQGETLQIVGGGSLSGNVYHMLPVPAGQQYGGFYTLNELPRTQFPNDYFSFVGLSDGQALPAEAFHAKTGAYIWMEIASVTGPAGAHFGFWDEGMSLYGTTPTVSFLTNTPTGGYKFEISEPLSQPAAPSGAILEPPTDLHYIINGTTTALTIDPGEDPYGHIHNRGWTVDQPGDYYIGFKAYDMSNNGAGGGPIQAPSVTYVLHFQAVPEPGSATLMMAGFVLCTLRRRRP